MSQLIAGAGSIDWPGMVREFLSHVQDVPAWLDVLVGDGRFAWKLMLDLEPDQVILDLGCGFGSAAGNIAPHVAKTYSMGLVVPELQFAGRRFSKLNSADDITLIAGGDAGRLPFADHCLDIVLLSDGLQWLQPAGEDESCWSVTTFLGEIHRVLKSDGQLFWATDNLLGYPNIIRGRLRAGRLLKIVRPHRFHIPGQFSGLTLKGYRSWLQDAGFDHTELLGLTPGRAYAENLLPVDVPLSYWHCEPPAGIRQRIRRSRHLVPAYGIIADNKEPDRETRLLDRLLTRIATDLECKISNLEILDFAVSRKNKAIIKVRARDQLVYLRIPMNRSALQAETDNRNMLISLHDNALVTGMVPLALAAGQDRSLAYFVESHVSGAPAYMRSSSVSAEVHLLDVERLLYRLNPGSFSRIRLTGALYEQLVGTRLAGLHGLLTPDDMSRMQALFDEQVRGIEVVQGISHGDFGVNNLFLDEQGAICGLIDWEYGLLDGLPVLDAINYVLISYRVRHGGDSLIQCMMWLSTNKWPEARYANFLQDYFKHYGLEAGNIRAFILLWWLYVVSYRLRSGMAFDPDEIKRYLTEVVNDLLSGE